MRSYVVIVVSYMEIHIQTCSNLDMLPLILWYEMCVLELKIRSLRNNHATRK